jgi:hypothetical protein
MAFVHHTDGPNDYTRAQAPGIVRGIYYYHARVLHWGDIGYNFLIDRYGTIYEGRKGGIAKGVVGAQTLGFNSGSTGVSMMGGFMNVAPPAAAIAALKRLLTWKLDVHHIYPLGQTTMTCAYAEKFRLGQKVTFLVISGHRQACYTSCPGDKLFALLPQIRKAVAATGLPKIYSFALGSSYLSPNGDGRLDDLSIHYTISQAADWTVQIKAASGAGGRRTGHLEWTQRRRQGGGGRRLHGGGDGDVLARHRSPGYRHGARGHGAAAGAAAHAEPGDDKPQRRRFRRCVRAQVPGQ